MKRAIVLSGGGAKGGYEIGVWKALRRLGIDYDIVTGTSVGALIGTLMVQKDYSKALKLWYYMDYTKVMDVEIKGKFSTTRGRNEIVSKYAKGALNGGYELSGLKKVIDDAFSEERFFKSDISYGLVTVYFPSFKPKYVTKENVDREEFKNYLLASASCFPAFKMTKIGNNNFIDGGYYDNLPINLAIKLGASEVIAVNTGAVGLTRKVENKNVNVIMINPRNNIGNFLAFEKDYARKAISFGYNDTMKIYNKLEGNIYTFRKNTLKRNYNKNYNEFCNLLNKYVNNITSSVKYKKIFGKKSEQEFNKVLENTAKAFSVDESKIYMTSILNLSIKKSFINSKIKSLSSIKRKIKNNVFKKNFINKELIMYIYEELENKKRKNKTLDYLAIFFPESFLCAIYLRTIMR